MTVLLISFLSNDCINCDRRLNGLCNPVPMCDNHFLRARYIIRSKIEPPTAMSKLRISKPVTPPNPMADQINPPIKDPAMPIRMVIKIPPGSLPGKINLAIIPTISPNIIQERMPI